MNEIIIDVSSLPPPEPMQQIITTLAQLNADQYLKVIHSRQPFPLFEKLINAGWDYQCNEVSANLFHLYIFKICDKSRVLLCI